MPLRAYVIVEGHGEIGAIRALLHRVWYEHLGFGDRLDVYPWRVPQGDILKEAKLRVAVEAAAIKLHHGRPADCRGLLLILVDSEGKCPKEHAPRLLGWAKAARPDADLACVMPHGMFETWFASAAESLRGINGLPADLDVPADPEPDVGKPRLRSHLARKYSETVDQPRFVAAMNLAVCRRRSPSFDELCRELERFRPPPA